MLPSRGWKTYESGLLNIGEHRGNLDPEVTEFLQSLGLVDDAGDRLTAAGKKLFHLRFIEDDDAGAREVLRHQLLTESVETGVLCQLLANRAHVPRGVAETVLRSQGHGAGLTDRKLGSLLTLLSHVGVIDYSKREGRFRILAKPLTEPQLPQSIFISPETPASNRLWLRRVVAECTGFIYWFDKHFLPEGLDFIIESADGARVTNVQVLSLLLPESDTRRARRAYRDASREMASRGVSLEWRFIDSREVRDVHDRWIVAQGCAWNVPNLNAILSGQHSEMVTSTNDIGLKEMFERVWERADPRSGSVETSSTQAPGCEPGTNTARSNGPLRR